MTQRTENEQQYDDAPLSDAPNTDDGSHPEASTAPDTAQDSAAEAEEVVEVEADAEPDLEQQLTSERERASGYLEELQRERASFINFRRRVEQEKEGWGREANAALIFNVLPVLDDFERARDAIPAGQQDTPWVDGLMLVGRKLYSTLELSGLKQIDAVGKPFDPSLHEAVAVEEAGDQEHSIVVEEYRKGYTLGDRVLRPSMVKVKQ